MAIPKLQSIPYFHQLATKDYIEEENLEKPCTNPYTPLHKAVLSGDVNECAALASNVEFLSSGDLRGDSPLHLAVRWINPKGVELMNVLTSCGADVNLKNKWGQTPLHYAVFVESPNNVAFLLDQESITVNSADINGYTPLHCCFRFRANSNDDPYSLKEKSATVDIIYKLILAGADIKAQTKYGDSILHLIAKRDDNTPLLKHIFDNYFTLNLNLHQQNLKDENFLHVYMISEVFEKVTEIIDFIDLNFIKNTVNDLLNTTDLMGRAPWAYMIDTFNIDEDSLARLYSLHADLTTSDNLGNTAVHRLAGVSTIYNDILEFLLFANVEVNAKNVYDESAASVFFLEHVFDSLLKYDIELNTQDRWGRTPLMSLLKHRPLPDLIRKVITKGKVNLNACDNNGSTPLHLAAYHNFEEQVELLLEHQADAFAVDSLGDKPIDTVRRHFSYRCFKQLAHTEKRVVLYSRTKSFEDLLLDMPKSICCSEIKTKENIESALHLPSIRSDFYEFLLNKFYKSSPENTEEMTQISVDVLKTVQTLCSVVESYDKRFKMTVFRTGSSVEGTKVGPPDEFDFALCIEELKEITCIAMTKECAEKGFVCLKFIQKPVPAEYQEFADNEEYFLAFPFLKLYEGYLKRALNERKVWSDGNLYFTYEDKMHVIRGKPVFNFSVYWIGTVYKQLKISIDLVPVVYNPGWWPANVKFPDFLDMDKKVKEAGCFLILQTRVNDFSSKAPLNEDDIFETCNTARDEKTRRMLRVSAAPAEIALMRTLPDPFRYAYILAKIVKSKEICPQIEIDVIPSPLFTIQEKFNRKKPLPINPPHAIKSYMLKNCTFYLWLEMYSSIRKGKTTDSYVDLAGRIYEYLLNLSDQRYLNPFFLPYSDVFEFEKDDTSSSYNELLLRLKREWSIKVCLGILQRDFPAECLSTKLF